MKWGKMLLLEQIGLLLPSYLSIRAIIPIINVTINKINGHIHHGILEVFNGISAEYMDDGIK